VAQQLAAEALGDEAGARLAMLMYLPTRSELTRLDEVVEVEVDVLHRAVELGGEVVAQPFRIEALRRGSSRR
jgi:hypothetical protein